MKNEHIALKFTEKSKNCSFINSKIYGQVEIAGEDHKFLEQIFIQDFR